MWFLAAPSRGFGVEMARQLLASGNEVVAAGGMGLKALACLPEAGGRLQLLTIDDSETTQVEAAVEAAIRRFRAYRLPGDFRLRRPARRY